MKRYEQNFKEEALKLLDEIGVKKACEQLNLNYGTLSGWRKLRAKENKNYGVERMKIALEQRGIKRSFSTVKRAMARGLPPVAYREKMAAVKTVA